MSKQFKALYKVLNATTASFSRVLLKVFMCINQVKVVTLVGTCIYTHDGHIGITHPLHHQVCSFFLAVPVLSNHYKKNGNQTLNGKK